MRALRSGGTAAAPASKSVTSGSTYGTLATISRTGYIFNGWFTAGSGGTLVTTSTTVTATADPRLTRIVHGYDAVLFVRGATPSGNL